MVFAAGLYFGERGAEGTTITTYGRALYWGIAAFSTAGIADMPVNGISEFIGAIWIVIGSMLFFGAIVATITAYFMRPLQRPSKQIIDTIEYNLEQLDDLSIEELELLKETTDSLIEHVERLKAAKGEDKTSTSRIKGVDPLYKIQGMLISTIRKTCFYSIYQVFYMRIYSYEKQG